jgi:hypothetical protein
MWRSLVVLAFALLSSASSPTASFLDEWISRKFQLETYRRQALEEDKVVEIASLDADIALLSTFIDGHVQSLNRDLVFLREQLVVAEKAEKELSQKYVEFVKTSQLIDFYTHVKVDSFSLDSNVDVPSEVAEYMVAELRFIVEMALRNKWEKDVIDRNIDHVFDSFQKSLPAPYLNRLVGDFVIEHGVHAVIENMKEAIHVAMREAVHHCQDVALDIVTIESVLSKLGTE